MIVHVDRKRASTLMRSRSLGMNPRDWAYGNGLRTNFGMKPRDRVYGRSQGSKTRDRS